MSRAVTQLDDLSAAFLDQVRTTPGTMHAERVDMRTVLETGLKISSY